MAAEDSKKTVKCMLLDCKQEAVGCGTLMGGAAFCAAHLAEDNQRFTEKYAELQQDNDAAIVKLRHLVKMTTNALEELNNDKVEVSNMFDAIVVRVQQCRQIVIGRLDAKIATLKANLTAWVPVEKHSAEIIDGWTMNDLVKNFRFHEELRATIGDLGLPAYWVDPKDSTLHLMDKLQNNVDALTEDVENCADTLTSKLMAHLPVLKFQNDSTNYCQYKSCESDRFLEYRRNFEHEIFSESMCSQFGMYDMSVGECNETGGFYYNTSCVSRDPSDDDMPLPSTCFVVLGNSELGWYHAYYDTQLILLSQWSVQASGILLVSAQCVSHLQQLFLLDSNKSLTVTDLAGTKLRTVDNLQFLGALASMTHDMEKLYILSDGRISCLSLDSCELQENIPLSEDVKGAVSVTVSGRSLMLTTASSVHRMSLATKRCVRLWQSNSQGLQCVADIGCGFLAACDVNGKVTLLSRSGQVVKDIDLLPSRFADWSCCSGNKHYLGDTIDFFSVPSSDLNLFFFGSVLQCNHLGLHLASFP